MPKPQEICVVTALGRRYDIWDTVEVIHSADDVIDHAMLTVAENSTGAKRLSDLKLKPGDPATVTLAGQMVLDGFVFLRQAAYDAHSHSVQIGIASKAQSIIPSTVDGKPGQYIQQSLQQIGSAVFGRVGVSFTVVAPDAGQPFPRINEHIGETRFNFIERLGRMRNVHLVDDGQGGIVGFRGPYNGYAQTVLREGHNILRARLLLKIDEHTDNLTVVGQNANNDDAGANTDVKAQTQVDPPANRPLKIPAEELGDQLAMQLRVNHEADWIKYQQVDGDITVQGWLTDQGTLWWNEREKVVAVVSPMLIPENEMAFMIKGIIHRQSTEEGTTTSILICRADGLGAGAEPLVEGNI